MSLRVEPVSAASVGAGGSVPFSPAYRVGDTVYTSGQVGLSPVTGVVPVEFADEVRQTMENLKRVLEAAGTGVSNVVKTTCLLSDIADLGAFNAVYEKEFPEPRPARSTFQVGLARNFRVEIEAIAVIR